MSRVLDRITFNPDICGGQACIREIRIPVSTLLKLIASGMHEQEILQEYPDLEREDLQAALEYAAWLASERILPPAA